MKEQTLPFRICGSRHEGYLPHCRAEGQSKPRSESSFGRKQQHGAPKVLDAQISSNKSSIFALCSPKPPETLDCGNHSRVIEKLTGLIVMQSFLLKESAASLPREEALWQKAFMGLKPWTKALNVNSYLVGIIPNQYLSETLRSTIIMKVMRFFSIFMSSERS